MRGRAAGAASTVALAGALAGCGASVHTGAPASSASTTTASSTTLAVTSTSAPSTTAAAATTSQAPSTTAASRQGALDAVVAGYGGRYAASPFSGQDRQQFVAVSHQVPLTGGGSQVEVDVYSWTGTALQRQAAVALGSDGSTGLLALASQGYTPITVVAVTGAATPDFAVTTNSASAFITSIVSDATCTWRAVPFVTSRGTVVGVPQATINGQTVQARFDDCTPNCAQGTIKTVSFTYQGGRMVAATS